MSSTMPKSSRRSLIPQDWKPSADDVAFAESKGIVDVGEVAEEFVEYHGGHGTLMLNWHLAFRTWVRNQVRWGRATGQCHMPLLAVIAKPDASDPWGINAWVASLNDTTTDTIDGKPVKCLNGYDVAGVASDVCQAAGLAQDWRGGLSVLAGWLREGITPDAILSVIRTSSPARPVTSLVYYGHRIRQQSERRTG